LATVQAVTILATISNVKAAMAPTKKYHHPKLRTINNAKAVTVKTNLVQQIAKGATYVNQ